MDGDRGPAAEDPPPRGSSALVASLGDVLLAEDDPAKAVAAVFGVLVPEHLDLCLVRLPDRDGPCVGSAEPRLVAALDAAVADVLLDGVPRQGVDGRPVHALPLRAGASPHGVLGVIGHLDPDTVRVLAALVALRLDGGTVARDSPVREARLSLRPRPQSAAAARAVVRDVLASNGMAALTDTALLLVSELVSNALRHGDGPYELLVGCDEGGLLVSVGDRSLSSPRPRRPVHDMLRPDSPGDDPLSLEEDGRGLLLVEALATDWGWTANGTGKRVWFRLDRA